VAYRTWYQRTYFPDFAGTYVPAYIPENRSRVGLIIQPGILATVVTGVIFGEALENPLLIRPGETLIIDQHCYQGVVTLIASAGQYVNVTEMVEVER